MRDMINAVWKYRFFIISSISNDLKVRFVRSKLGALWMIVHPLAQVLIFALILSEVLSAKLPGIESKYAYALYLMSGILAWSLFSETLTKCLTLFVDNGNLMKKMAFPRICLPLILVGGVIVNNILLMFSIFCVFAFLGFFPDSEVLWLPILMLLTLMLSLGLGLIFGVMNVWMRDAGQVVPVILQALFWMTPIVYSLSILPEGYRHWFSMNPLYPLITSYQNVMVFGKPPLWGDLVWLAAWSCGLLLLALLMFRRASLDMVDAL